jgi:hypothetical protein
MLIELDYLSEPKARYANEPHQQLWRTINEGRARYAGRLKKIAQLPADWRNIPSNPDGTSGPHWNNSFFAPLDAVALTGMIRDCRPKLYLEIGSGNSTRFARRATQLYSPNTRIVSIDPEPRVEIDAICDEVIRKPVESVDMDVFNRLESGDFLFVDNSHRCLMNSDVTVIFLDILPRLKSGVFIHFHDIFLPWDYPQEWVERYYSEQYLLACWLLAGLKLHVELPNLFIVNDPELSSLLEPIWPHIGATERAGCSFWCSVH